MRKPQLSQMLSFNRNTHIPTDPTTGIPAIRILFLASNTFNQRVDGHLVTILTSTIKSDPSKESMLDGLNQKINGWEINPTKLVVGSLDVSNLYESVNTKLAGQIAKQTVIDSELKFEGVDYQWGAVYLALLMSPIDSVNAKIQYLLARRKTNKTDHQLSWQQITRRKLTDCGIPKIPKLTMIRKRRGY